MTTFRIIPVLDILNGIAVHAKKGERKEYRSLHSKLFKTTNPVEIISKLKDLSFHEFYIADLDSILSKRPNLKIYEQILALGNVDLMLDIGIENREDLKIFDQLGINKIILGLETISNLDIVKNSLHKYGNNSIIISVDMYEGSVISNNRVIEKMTIFDLIETFNSIGIKEIILLDLFKVGTKVGGIPKKYLEIKDLFNNRILVGGGIRDIQDVKLYKQKGFDGVILATALYDGTIRISELKKF